MNYRLPSERHVWILSHDGVVISSITTIDTNIKKCYKELFPNLVECELSNKGSGDAVKLLREFEKASPDLVIVTHPLVIGHDSFKYLLASKKAEGTQFIIHIYGDFFRRGPNYSLLESLMMNKKVKCIFPSKGYLEVVKSSFKDSNDISVVPVPVEKESFYFNQYERTETRNKYGLSDKEIVFIYSGRIIQQKNVFLAAQILKEVCYGLDRPYKFLLVGNCDDYEGATVGTEQPLGTMYSELIEANDEHIIFLGHKQRDELRKIYNVSDVFISLGTFHDESFGLSPLEALMCGVSCLLSCWGGYRDYESTSKDYCQMLDVHFTKEGFEFSVSEFMEKLKLLLSKINKENCSDLYQAEYGHEAVKEKIRMHIQNSETTSFKGFSEKYHQMSLETLKSNNTLSRASYSAKYNGMWV